MAKRELRARRPDRTDIRDSAEHKITPEIAAEARREILVADPEGDFTRGQFRQLARSFVPEAMAKVVTILRVGSQRNQLKAAEIIGEWAYEFEAGENREAAKQGIAEFLSSLRTPTIADGTGGRMGIPPCINGTVAALPGPVCSGSDGGESGAVAGPGVDCSSDAQSRGDSFRSWRGQDDMAGVADLVVHVDAVSDAGSLHGADARAAQGYSLGGIDGVAREAERAVQKPS